MNKSFFKISFLYIILFSIQSLAQIKELVLHSGNGCPKGTLSSTIAPDGSAISILFDKFSDQSTVHMYKKCFVRIKVNVPSGFKMDEITADYRGFASIPEKAQGYFAANLAQRVGLWTLASQNKAQALKASQDVEINMSQKLQAKANTRCRAHTEHIDVSMAFALRNFNHNEALISIDSLDAGATQVGVQLTRCYGGPDRRLPEPATREQMR